MIPYTVAFRFSASSTDATKKLARKTRATPETSVRSIAPLANGKSLVRARKSRAALEPYGSLRLCSYFRYLALDPPPRRCRLDLMGPRRAPPEPPWKRASQPRVSTGRSIPTDTEGAHHGVRTINVLGLCPDESLHGLSVQKSEALSSVDLPTVPPPSIRSSLSMVSPTSSLTSRPSFRIYSRKTAKFPSISSATREFCIAPVGIPDLVGRMPSSRC